MQKKINFTIKAQVCYNPNVLATHEHSIQNKDDTMNVNKLRAYEPLWDNWHIARIS